MKRMVSFLIAFTLVLMGIPFTSYGTMISYAQGIYGTVDTTGDVNVRTGPGLAYDTIGSVKKGSTLDYLGDTSIDDRGIAWYRIDYKGNQNAWVSSKYGKLTENGNNDALGANTEVSMVQTPNVSVSSQSTAATNMVDCKVGDIVVFGTYEQDNIISNGQEPLYWRVLEREGNRVMLATRDLIDRMQFHDGINWREDAVWEASTIRGWLNSEFINTAFSISEQMMIEYSELTTQSESICTDRVFLLSKDEAAAYFAEDTPRLTAYTEAKTGYYAQTDSYWLRTSSGNDVYIVNKSGYITYTGTEMTYGTVRPVMWLNLDITSDTNVITATSTDYKIGDTVFIGSWEQDGDTANGMEPIAWQIIGLENDIATLLANSGLERRAYNSSNIDVTWERSTLRMWLNSEFFIEAFTPEEQTSIQLTQLSNPSVWSTYGGANTTDRVYLLSKYEIDELFPDEDSRRLSPTQYARSQGAGGGTYCVWWTRSPGARENYATRVYENGSYSNGAEVNYGGTCVRPVIRVSINSTSLYKSDEQLQAQAEYVLPSRYNINDTVVFGRYEQDGDLSNGAEPLEWDILDIKNDQALIITDDVIDIVQYEDDGYKSDWENSYLRAWLNSDFMAQAFTADEQSAIIATEVDNSMSANGRKCDAAATIDSVFCLSRAELEALYATEKSRQGFTSLWVGMRERQEKPNMLFSTAKYWWLRDSGVESLDALLVGYEGQLMQMDVDADFGVRPVLWVELSEFESLDDARIAAEAKAAAEAEIAAQEAAAREAAAQQAAWEALPEDERVMRGLIEGASGTKCDIWCGDYDGNGIGEAFALAGEQDEFGRSELWYSDGNTAWRIDTSDGMGYEKSSTSYKTGNGMIFCAVDGFTSTSASRIWYVEDGQPVYASKGDDIGWVSQYGESDFSFTHDAYDASTDGTGHTWKRYYAYWDGDGFTEYGGIYINEAQLRGVEGASKWLDEIVNKGYRITGILYRSNGIVNINYSNGDANYNATLLIKDGIATLEIVDDDGTDALFASSYGGVYQTSVLTRAAYPEEFPFEAAPAKSTVPEYNENNGTVTGDVISKQDILDSYGVFNFDELINIRSVEASKIDGGQHFDIWFEEDVYWGGSEGYHLDWLTTNGILSEVYSDLDGDGADEYVIVHVNSESITEYGYTYVQNVWRVTVFEAIENGYIFSDTMTVPLGWGGERFVRIIPNDSGDRIFFGSIGYWDGGVAGISLELYQYNGNKLYLEMTAEITNEGSSYMATLPVTPDRKEELQEACNSYAYDVSEAYALGLVEGENFLYETRSDGDWQVWDSETGAIIKSAFEAYQKVCDAVRIYGIDAGYTIHESGGYELWIRNGDNLIWASEDFEDGDALIRYDVCTALEYDMPSVRDAAESIPENITSGTVITTGNVNLRTGPGKGYSTVTSIGAGKTLAYLGETQYDDRNPPVAWHKVRLDNGTEAWISSKYGQLNGTEIVSDNSFQNLAKGSTGNRVLELQQMLAELGFHTGSCDGDFGNQTANSVKAFQEAMGLTVTGEVDETTWQKLEAALIEGVRDDSYCSVHGNILFLGEDCCACLGYHVFGDDPHYCMSCLEQFEVCDHVVTYSEHPHYEAYCEVCGMEFSDQHRVQGRVLSYCAKCFSKDGCSQERALEMGQLALDTYEMERGSETNKLVISDDGLPFATTECLISTSMTDDGELILTIAFEGSTFDNLLIDGVDDWFTKDLWTSINSEGIRIGMYSGIERFVEMYISDETMIDVTLDGMNGYYPLEYLLDQVKKNPGAHIRITGHSLGGSYAQCMTHYLINEYGISSDKIETYTFAALPPFDELYHIRYPHMADVNVYNYINVQDWAPDVGADDSIGSLLYNVFATAGGEGNIGQNLYIDSEMDDSLVNMAGDDGTHAMKTYMGLLERYTKIYTVSPKTHAEAKEKLNELMNKAGQEYHLVVEIDGEWQYESIPEDYDYIDLYMQWDDICQDAGGTKMVIVHRNARGWNQTAGDSIVTAAQMAENYGETKEELEGRIKVIYYLYKQTMVEPE